MSKRKIRCDVCNVEKSISNFWKSKNSKDIMHNSCIECRNKANEEQKGQQLDSVVMPNYNIYRELADKCLMVYKNENKKK